MSDADGRVPCLGAERWGYKCSVCTIIFSSRQGLAGHMQSHRYDDAYKKGTSHQRVLYRPIIFQSSSSVRNDVVSCHQPPPLPPPPVRFRPPVSDVTHRCHVSAAIQQPGFGGSGLGSSWSVRPRPAVALPPPANRMPGLPRVFAGESSSGRMVIIHPRGWLAARRGGGGGGGGEEEEVTPRDSMEVDTELRLGR